MTESVSDFAPGLTRFPLTELPTPVRRMSALEARLGGPSLWIKSDDRSGPLYGGNKPRKLEYLIGRALERGRAGVLTTGGTGTHHGLATTIAARQAGLRSVLVLLPQPVTDHVLEAMQLMHAYGAEMHLAESVTGVATRGLSLIAGGMLRGEPLELIPTGGTNALGAIGFVRAGMELAEQVRAGELPEPDIIFTALGTGGTAAGLVAGLRIAGLRSRVVSVLVTDLLAPTGRRLAKLAAATVRRLRRSGQAVPPLALAREDFQISREYLGDGYGVPTVAGERAARAAHELEGIELEPTYTAKTFAAFIDAARRGHPGESLLFWNTFNSIDPHGGIERLSAPSELPAAFHRFWSEPVQRQTC